MAMVMKYRIFSIVERYLECLIDFLCSAFSLHNPTVKFESLYFNFHA